MKPLAYSLALFLIVGVAAGQSDTKAVADFQAAAHWFDYDSKQSLDIHDKVIEEFNGGTLHNITYVSPEGGPVNAYLVVPAGKGPFAAILFGHCLHSIKILRSSSAHWECCECFSGGGPNRKLRINAR